MSPSGGPLPVLLPSASECMAMELGGRERTEDSLPARLYMATVQSMGLHGVHVWAEQALLLKSPI